MIMRVLSLDISASSTGWAFASGSARAPFSYGLIKTSNKFTLSERLAYFKNELYRLLLEFKPTHVVMEDVFAGLNNKTLIMLAKFAGVAMETCYSTAGSDPYIIHTNTVKSYFKVKNKEQLFYMIADVCDWEKDKVSFKKHNDLTDAIAQLMCYYDYVLGYKNFRIEKDYGFLYEV